MHLVADRDRDRASASLRQHYVSGRLTLEEFSERVELALRARTNRDLRAARRGLPAPWASSELARVAETAGHAARRALLFCALVSLWSIVSFVLLTAFVVVVAVDASTGAQLAVPIVWAGATFLIWRAWRRPAARASR
jgi:hypothetical protein